MRFICNIFKNRKKTVRETTDGGDHIRYIGGIQPPYPLGQSVALGRNGKVVAHYEVGCRDVDDIDDLVKSLKQLEKMLRQRKARNAKRKA
jgi:hypothetical protein